MRITVRSEGAASAGCTAAAPTPPTNASTDNAADPIDANDMRYPPSFLTGDFATRVGSSDGFWRVAGRRFDRQPVAVAAQKGVKGGRGNRSGPPFSPGK